MPAEVKRWTLNSASAALGALLGAAGVFAAVIFSAADTKNLATQGANGAKDMALSVQITGKGSITAMVLSDANGKGWDTLPGNNGRWLLGVRLGNKLQNTANGTVRVAVNGTKTYQLLMQDNGKLAAKKGALTLTTTWGDGEVTETELKW